jgi:hypothetical protein
MCEHCINRRQFNAMASAGVAGGMLGLSWVAADESAIVQPYEPDTAPIVTGRPAGSVPSAPSMRPAAGLASRVLCATIPSLPFVAASRTSRSRAIGSD